MHSKIKSLVYVTLFIICVQRSAELLQLFFFEEGASAFIEAKYISLHLTSHSSSLLPVQFFSL